MKRVMEYIGKNYQFFNEIANNITRGNGDGDELLNQTIINVSDNFNKTKIIEAYEGNYFKWLFIRMLKSEYTLSNTYYFRQIKKYETKNSELKYNNDAVQNDYLTQIEDDYGKYVKEMIFNILDKAIEANIVEWWQVQVYKRYNFSLEKTSFRKLQNSVNIAESSLWRANQIVSDLVEKRMDNIKGKI